ncbi:MAG: hypothetical protein HY301_16945 [Verrucomicrobia bacterium]|nr:hypothetical protein [Verrucomicrobiota bacterium]
MNTPARKTALPWVLLASGVLLFLLPWFWSRHLHAHLGRPALVTGWWLFAVMVFLCGFNARKRLAMLPLGSASAWLAWHVTGGFLTLALFWLHTRSLWPRGLYEQALAGLFYLLNFSGIVGWILQRAYPRMLTGSGVEIIYERIPAEVARLRGGAEAVVLACTRATGSDTLARHYLETLDWFFRRPRFFASHALSGGRKARAWLRQQCAAVRLYLNDAERAHLNRLTALAERKLEIDFHHAAQSLMKRWLLLHLPLAAAVMLLALWHVFLVCVYAL